MEKRYNINIDRLEITYKAKNEIKDRLLRNDKVVFDGFWCERIERRHYENEFALWCDEYDEEKDIMFPRLFGYVYFGSYNPYR